MRCEECLQLIDLFFDGELDEPTADRVTGHIASCAVCASTYRKLEREQDFFLSYECDVEFLPAFWNDVQAKITQEKTARCSWSLHRLHTWSANVYGDFRALRFTPTMTAIIVLVTIAVTVGLMSNINSLQDSPEKTIALRSERTDVELPSTEPSKAAAPVNTGENSTGNKFDSKANKSVQQPLTDSQGAAKKSKAVRPMIEENVRRESRKPPASVDDQTPTQLIRDAEQKYLRAIAMLSQNASRRRSRLDPATASRFAHTLATVDRTIAGTRRAVREHPEDPVAIQFMLMAYAKKVDVLREMAAY